MIINNILFPKLYTFKFQNKEDLNELIPKMFPEFYFLKDDPYYGIDPKEYYKIKSDYLIYRNNNLIYFYYSSLFINLPHSFKPFYPYFKGTFENENNNIILKGRLQFNNFASWVMSLGTILLIIFLIAFSFPLTIIILSLLLAFYKIGAGIVLGVILAETIKKKIK